tara:strand:- start:429 stop:1178 length:750 start_codon:yes stop_codon:yes gene_type:complete
VKLLILGHLGMLGSAVKKYYDFANVEIIEDRWPSEEFKKKVSEFDGDLIINCLGAVPQRTNDFSINKEVPKFLCSNISSDIKIINPTSDCVFEGTNEKPYEKTHPCDTTSEYGKSKVFQPPESCINFINIRTSFVGYDADNKELLSWFLSQERPVNGYTNHWWNGITTYEWAKLSHRVYTDWDMLKTSLIQVGTAPVTKYELLHMIKDVYGCDTVINPLATKKTVNKVLVSDFAIKPLLDQLNELRELL